jgi:hypothetical protein
MSRPGFLSRHAQHSQTRLDIIYTYWVPYTGSIHALRVLGSILASRHAPVLIALALSLYPSLSMSSQLNLISCQHTFHSIMTLPLQVCDTLSLSTNGSCYTYVTRNAISHVQTVLYLARTCISSMAGLSLKLIVCKDVPEEASQILIVLSAEAVAIRRLSSAYQIMHCGAPTRQSNKCSRRKHRSQKCRAGSMNMSNKCDRQSRIYEYEQQMQPAENRNTCVTGSAPI